MGQQLLSCVSECVVYGAAAARAGIFAGVNLLQESNLIAGLLLNGMFLLGTFTFAVVLGVVSDDISSEVKVWCWRSDVCMCFGLCSLHTVQLWICSASSRRVHLTPSVESSICNVLPLLCTVLIAGCQRVHSGAVHKHAFCMLLYPQYVA